MPCALMVLSVDDHDGRFWPIRTTGLQQLLGPLAVMILPPVTVRAGAKSDRSPKESRSKAGESYVQTDAVLMRRKVVRRVCW